MRRRQQCQRERSRNAHRSCPFPSPGGIHRGSGILALTWHPVPLGSDSNSLCLLLISPPAGYRQQKARVCLLPLYESDGQRGPTIQSSKVTPRCPCPELFVLPSHNDVCWALPGTAHLSPLPAPPHLVPRLKEQWYLACVGRKSLFCFLKKHGCNRAFPLFSLHSFEVTIAILCPHNSWMPFFSPPPRTSVSCCQHELEGWELIWPLLILLLSLTRTGTPKMIFRLRLGLTGLDKRSRLEELPGSFSLWLWCVHLNRLPPHQSFCKYGLFAPSPDYRGYCQLKGSSFKIQETKNQPKFARCQVFLLALDPGMVQNQEPSLWHHTSQPGGLCSFLP